MMDEMQGMPPNEAQGQMPPEQMQGGDMPADPAVEQGGQPPRRTREDILGEIEGGREYLEKELVKELAQMVENDPSLEDLFFENKEEFFQRILDVIGDEMQSRFFDKQNELLEYNQEEDFQNRLNTFGNAMDLFAQQHPEVDLKSLSDFYAYLPQEVKSRLNALAGVDPEAMVQRLYDLYQQSQSQNQAQGGEPNQDDELPQQLNGMPAQTSELEPELDLPTSRY